MKMFDIIDKSNSVSKLLKKILKIEAHWFKQYDSKTVVLTEEEFNIIQTKVEQLIESEKQKNCKLLVRGESISKLIYKLNNSYCSKVFSIGEKAQNYLENMNRDRDAFKTINDVSQKTMEWIFDEYSVIHWGQNNVQNFFHDSNNKGEFVSKLANNEKLRDYYLYGLQTEGSKRKVFFVSSSTSPQKALYNEQKKVLILFWIPEPHIDYAQSKSSLNQISKEIKSNGLPLLQDSYFPEEKEYSIKGVIFPDFIYSIINVDDEKIIISPRLLIEKSDWIADGFDIYPDSFKNDYRTSNYKKYVMRYSTNEYIDK